MLDADNKELRLAAGAADDRAEVLAREKVQVMGLVEELRADVAAKMALLDEFEARFARQYRYGLKRLQCTTIYAVLCPFVEYFSSCWLSCAISTISGKQIKACGDVHFIIFWRLVRGCAQHSHSLRASMGGSLPLLEGAARGMRANAER